VLDPASSTLALSLLASVVEEQSWGVGKAADPGRGGVVYFKNGWLPTETGWIVHSIGLLSEGSQRFVLVFMTDQKQSFEKTVETIESAVALTRAGLFPPTPTPKPSPSRDIHPTWEVTTGPAIERPPGLTPERGIEVPEGCAPALLRTPEPDSGRGLSEDPCLDPSQGGP
jgi:hypothetical protein